MMNPIVLVGCEESQVVTTEFRKLGIEAYSCDLQECSGGYPQWHLQMDVFDAIELKKPKLFIGHPPCTYLTVTANSWYKDQPLRKSGVLVGEARREARREAIEFFIRMFNVDVPMIALENPIGVISSEFRKPDQIIHPYYFGDNSRKATCLWLKNLPLIVHNKEVNLFDEVITHVEPDIYYFKNGKGSCSRDYIVALSQKDDRAKIRSKTYPSFAKALAHQWGALL